MKKIFTLLILLLLLPVTALAARNDRPNSLYVGNTKITSAGYWTSSDDGTNWTSQQEKPEEDSYIYYDGDGTLTLHNVSIQGKYNETISGHGIDARSYSGSVSLSIVLEGENNVSGMYGINVINEVGNASLNIRGQGSLTVSGHSGNGIGIFVSANGSDTNLTIEEANVTASGNQDGGSGVQLTTSQSGSPNLTIAVKSGSLQASGETNGINFFSNANNADAVANLQVSGNAMVKASNIRTTKNGTGSLPELKPAASGSDGTGGIIWDGKEGTVYGDVTLQEDITIGEGESLTLDDGANLSAGDHNVIVDGGTLDEKLKESLGDKVKYAPAITTTSLSDGTVGTAYSQTLAATGSEVIIWSVTSGLLPDGLSLSEDGKITGTPTIEGESTFTVKAENSVGSDSKQYTLNIKAVSVTGVKLNKTELALFTDDSEILTATIEPDNATNQAVTWESSDHNVATVDNGKVSAVAAGEAIITVTTADGGKTATCQVKVTQSTYSITADITTLDFGSAYIKYSQPVAQSVTITNNGNQDLTLNQPASTKGFEVGNLSTTSLPVNGTATFTVQPKAALEAGTYKEEIVVSGSNQVTLTISATFNVRNPIEVKPSGSTNLSFTTDQDEFTLTATVQVNGDFLNPTDGSWTWAVADADVVERVTLRSKAVSYSTSRQAFTVEGTGTTTITATYDDGTYRGSEEFKVSISKPTPPDPISYYNIYVEDVCDGVEVTLSNNVVREGNSISVYVKKDTVNYTFDNFKVYYKRSYYGTWDELKEGTQPGEYPIKNIWNHIYIKAEGAKEKEDPTGIESIEGVNVYTKDGSLYVQTPQREQVIIVSMSGAVVKNEEQVGLKQYHGLQPGIYIVRVGDRAYKLRLN